MSNQKIILLAGRGISTNIIYHALKNDFTIDTIILEDPVEKMTFLKKRIKKLGLWKVTGQILFQLIIVNILDLTASKRKREIRKQFSMNNGPLPAEKIKRVTSVNDDSCLELLKSIDPQLVVVNGTRIISKQVLECVGARFINIHAGITPKYRGVHGAYWALLNNDEKNCGVTIHLVDEGIDTGGVIAQKAVTVSPKDNFVTYPLLQLAEGIPFLKKAIADILDNRLITVKGTDENGLWYHPGIGGYLYNRIVKGKK